MRRPLHVVSRLLRAAVASVLALLLAGALCARVPLIDGRIEADEWNGARHINDFRTVQPMTRAGARLRTEAWVLATPEGLAIAFRNHQPPGVPRIAPRGGRDQVPPADRVNVYVDFDGDGRVGYNFVVSLSGDIGDTTIAGENRFNPDWDGDWRRATSEDEEGWSAELLIPWHVAPMAAARGSMRTIGLSLDRVTAHNNERVAWPAITWSEPRFLSAFARIEVEAHEQSLLAITPYVSGLQDQVSGRFEASTGFDLFWKPHGRLQLSATLNPDFGQVESDDLVVNFGAVENFFNDKRPFFTENQAFFDVGFGGLGNANRLLYTRRVGGRADDGSGAGEVAGAVKLNGSAGRLGYGLFAASESGDAGRDFLAARVAGAGERWSGGAMLTEVKRPFLDRVARVASLDHAWRPDERLSLRAGLVLSDIEAPVRGGRDSGGQIHIDHELGGGWRQQFYAVHLGRNLQLNDFGYLERNDFNYARYELQRRRDDLPAEGRAASRIDRYAASRRMDDRGLVLFDTVAMNRSTELRDGGFRFWDVYATGPYIDDLVLRGNGIVRMPGRLGLYGERRWARPAGGRFEYEIDVRHANEGFDGRGKGLVELSAETVYHASDRVRVELELELERNADWVIWRRGNALGQFDGRQVFLGAGAIWKLDERQELRLKLEAIAIDAEARALWRVDGAGVARRTGEALDDFALQNLGFQLRYRYEIAPLSDLYLAYVRGGALFRESAQGFGLGDEFRGAFDLRDSEQLLVKLSYRFTL
ncbi:MAG: hypothetical protein KatS3mg127_1509 [Silanimonas sp.]|nr:MAG: hypothetical protein KatS3mg127_1509 [Silanimonas sp.]